MLFWSMIDLVLDVDKLVLFCSYVQSLCNLGLLESGFVNQIFITLQSLYLVFVRRQWYISLWGS